MREADDRRFMLEALALARRGLDANEVPIGAVVALDGNVVSSAYWRYRDGLLDHAELVALRTADRDARVQGRRRDVTLYSTLEPCPLCMGAAMAFLAGRVVYALESPSDGAAEHPEVWQPDRGHPPAGQPPYAVPEIVGGVCRDESLALVEACAEQNPDLVWVRTLLPSS
jgi:tRNA(adenine34) deaminase